MNFVVRMLFALGSPLQTLSALGHRLRLKFRLPAQVERMREITREAPLILQIETTNSCNARCVFCAYTNMKRPKGVMSMALFAKTVQDYCAMGGGAVSLTPVVGDALLDPHLLERLRFLQAQPEISQISLTTNAIALDRYSDEEVCYLLETLACIQVSIGGLDSETYRKLYGVDRFPDVNGAMERLLSLKDTVSDPAKISFAFRTNDGKFAFRFRRQMREYRRQGVFVSHISSYANYAGLVQTDATLNLKVLNGQDEKFLPCIYASVHMAVCWDGKITACGCADFEADALRIGQAEDDSLQKIWCGEKRLAILNSFYLRKPPGICQKCSAYQPDIFVFSESFCREIAPHRPLPLEYFQKFWGG